MEVLFSTTRIENPANNLDYLQVDAEVTEFNEKAQVNIQWSEIPVNSKIATSKFFKDLKVAFENILANRLVIKKDTKINSLHQIVNNGINTDLPGTIDPVRINAFEQRIV
jgi:hypothetical protein